jgi:hypothetical protein
METMKEWCKKNKIKTTSEQKRAGRLLENLGWKFLTDFGYENAVSTANAKLGFNSAPKTETVNALVLEILRKGFNWWTPWDLINKLASKEIYVSDASVTARLRDLRKPRYGAWSIEKRRIENCGAYEYRLGR